MKQMILDRIRVVNGGVSFAELECIEGFRGDLAWGIADKNIYFWFGLSPEAIDALEKLLDDGLIEMKPTTPLVYAIDGAIPSVPVAKQKRSYVSERWLPVTFNPLGEYDHRAVFRRVYEAAREAERDLEQLK